MYHSTPYVIVKKYGGVTSYWFCNCQIKQVRYFFTITLKGKYEVFIEETICLVMCELTLIYLCGFPDDMKTPRINLFIPRYAISTYIRNPSY